MNNALSRPRVLPPWILPPSVLVRRCKLSANCGRGGGVLSTASPAAWVAVVLAGVLLAGCATARQPFDVTLEVDFGPAGKPPVRQVVQVDPGATPQDATAKVFPVEKGSVCCDPRETSSIGGVATDPASNTWWTISVNGSRKVSPYKTKLAAGDVVRWEYRQYDQ